MQKVRGKDKTKFQKFPLFLIDETRRILRILSSLDCVLLPRWVPFTYSAPHNCVGWVGANYDARPGLVGVGGWWPQLALPPSEP